MEKQSSIIKNYNDGNRVRGDSGMSFSSFSSPRMQDADGEMFTVLGDTILDYQVTVLIGLHDTTVQFNVDSQNNQGKYIHKKRESVACQLRRIAQEIELVREVGGKKKPYELNMSVFFQNTFQRMITLIDEIKSLTTREVDVDKTTQEMLDRMESMNFTCKPGDNSPRTHEFQYSLMENINAKSLHKMNHPTIAMYNHCRLLYNMVNDDVRTREDAQRVGEDELAHFIGSKVNLDFFDNSHDVHLKLSSSFIKKTLNWMNLYGDANKRGVLSGASKRGSGDMFDGHDDVDIE